MTEEDLEEDVVRAITYLGRAITRCGFRDVEDCRQFLKQAAEKRGLTYGEEKLEGDAQTLYRISRKWMD